MASFLLYRLFGCSTLWIEIFRHILQWSFSVIWYIHSSPSLASIWFQSSQLIPCCVLCVQNVVAPCQVSPIWLFPDHALVLFSSVDLAGASNYLHWRLGCYTLPALYHSVYIILRSKSCPLMSSVFVCLCSPLLGTWFLVTSDVGCQTNTTTQANCVTSSFRCHGYFRLLSLSSTRNALLYCSVIPSLRGRVLLTIRPRFSFSDGLSSVSCYRAHTDNLCTPAMRFLGSTLSQLPPSRRVGLCSWYVLHPLLGCDCALIDWWLIVLFLTFCSTDFSGFTVELLTLVLDAWYAFLHISLWDTAWHTCWYLGYTVPALSLCSCTLLLVRLPDNCSELLGSLTCSWFLCPLLL